MAKKGSKCTCVGVAVAVGVGAGVKCGTYCKRQTAAGQRSIIMELLR